MVFGIVVASVIIFVGVIYLDLRVRLDHLRASGRFLRPTSTLLLTELSCNLNIELRPFNLIKCLLSDRIRRGGASFAAITFLVIFVVSEYTFTSVSLSSRFKLN
jgi:hypothetical protein